MSKLYIRYGNQHTGETHGITYDQRHIEQLSAMPKFCYVVVSTVREDHIVDADRMLKELMVQMRVGQ